MKIISEKGGKTVAKDMKALMADMDEPTELDLMTVRSQIGRSTSATLKVAARCSWGLPQVVLTTPLVQGKSGTRVFTTLFWLTCPFLHRVISTLESEGWVSGLKGWSEEEMIRAAEDYRSLRVQLLELLGINHENLSQGISRTLRETGIGGIRRDGGIKCLHLHVAHQLSTGGNPVGERVLQMIAQRNWKCDSPCFSMESEKC
ncbi:MAG: DUF501 domain-containing protein [Candidatus Wallbacteria bacterium HGW-Wallbacteria-1]|uniref:DUF501 domain-containing protein n=1 Tax=Candidatus Wallbacteria bacterium HGW-Wallbacteria-1 TaxID=2013854 RepID=A0A2N1PTZ9_9BACT|nr:MAG: DUF501 domain-containing protein [Candidatus Wallbacteria bacterium HGW-Wallbacteria-1]